MAVLRTLAALVCGLAFGLGLAVSGMMNPAKVIGFLDVAGSWDPTLAEEVSGYRARCWERPLGIGRSGTRCGEIPDADRRFRVSIGGVALLGS
jgi:uncharacterized membrane protein YedE/YeeE